MTTTGAAFEPRSIRVAVIGAGVSGLAMAVKLRSADIPFTVFEKGSEIGGTWRDNRYPGLTCDVPVIGYCFSFDPQSGSNRLLAGPEELQAHLFGVVDRFDLGSDIRLNSEIVESRWTDDHWELLDSSGDTHHADVLVHACGFLHHPKYPDIPGLDDFQGPVLHSARWDPAVDLTGRVGVIGSGSTGVQLVSALVDTAAKVSVFQRTPQWILPVKDVAVPRFIGRFLSRSPSRGARARSLSLSLIAYILGDAALKDGVARRMMAALCTWNLKRVDDPMLRSRLTPSDAPGCKRPVMSWSFYPAIQRANAELVDMGIERVERNGVRTVDGRLHELDVLALATGFQSHAYMRPMAVTGIDGRTLDEMWGDSPYAYHSLAVTGFPNMFLMLGPHAPLTHVSPQETAESVADYVVRAVVLLQRGDVTGLSPTSEATARWIADIKVGMEGTIWAQGCSSWYQNADGVPVNFPFSRKRWHEYVAGPDPADFAVTTPSTGTAKNRRG